jgi:methyl-accepting chemotaxis protein
MQWFKNLKTAKKLVLGFGLMAVLTGLVGYEGISSMGAIHGALEDLYQKHALGITYLNEANVDLLKISPAVRNAILDDDAADIQKWIDDIKKYRESFRHEFGAYQKTIVKAETKEKAAEVLKLFEELGPEQDKVLDDAKANKDDEARADLKHIRAMADKIDQEMEELEKSKRQLMEETH